LNGCPARRWPQVFTKKCCISKSRMSMNITRAQSRTEKQKNWPPTSTKTFVRVRANVSRKSAKRLNRKSVSPNPTLQRRRILHLVTIPRVITHRELATIAALHRVMIAAEIEAVTVEAIADVAGDVAAGAVVVAEVEVEAAVVATAAGIRGRVRADAIFPPQNMLPRKVENGIHAVAAVTKIDARPIAGRAHLSNRVKTISCCRANRWPSIAESQHPLQSLRSSIMSPRSASLISNRRLRVPQLV
jgi:hypothetical protein